ncbi:MAG TPA: PEP-CTERM sorting domain-containing protein [Kiritimatiellia bacterium]|nr:PEP-CTERM sorting domain-containing protein [Kiritimatiellia bacterium]HMO98392.1 PEP-CTERM sorting domain-containing protein [Kiritimatiellia bacterium]HMP96445.1 PEP-CTERM sorting domain-containing protein [Kiritimatiellia bacterium]
MTAQAAFVEDPIHHERLLRRALEQPPQIPQLLELSGNAVSNGTFEAGLDFWNVTGTVQVLAGEAVISDTLPFAMLHQTVLLTSGVYTLSFDFRPALSDQTERGRFPDTFFASLYFTDDDSTLDIPGLVFDEAAPLFDLDWMGIFNNQGTVGPSALGPDWFHFTYEFTMVYQYVAVAFELAGINGVNGDSSVRIDNVMIAVVPEPATWAFLGCGAWVWWIRRRRL